MIFTRFKTTKTAVMGVLKDDKGGTYFVLENAMTLIPAGKYTIEVTYSPKFKRDLPLLVGIPGTDTASVTADRGVRIHSGNTSGDSRACPLVGNTADLAAMSIGASKAALEQLLKSFSGKNAELTIESRI